LKLLKARETPDSYRLAVHLDETKLDNAGNPDPAFVAVYNWNKTRPGGMTKLQHLAQIRTETKALAQAEAARRNADEGTQLAGEGNTL